MISLLGMLFVNLAFARGEGGEKLSREERQAKMKERYENASPEKKAKIDARRKKRQEKAKELGFDLSTEEGRKGFHKYRKENRSN